MRRTVFFCHESLKQDGNSIVAEKARVSEKSPEARAPILHDMDINRALVEFLSRRQAVLGRQDLITTPWLTERHGYDPT